MHRAIDNVFIKNAAASHTATASEAAGSAVDLTANMPNTEPAAEIDVTAASGTAPTLDVGVEGSNDGTTWATAGTFAQKTAAGREVITLSRFAQYRRKASTITGTTPSFTYSIKVFGLASIRPVTQP